MGDLTANQPKCRVQLHGRALIEWQLAALRDAGMTEIAIVRGYLAESFEYPLHYFDNHRWQSTNMVSSLCTASPWLTETPCLISYSDIVYSADAVRRLQSCEAPLAITYDPHWLRLWQARFAQPLHDAESFVLDDEGRVTDIGRRVATLAEIQGQYMGLLRMTPAAWHDIMTLLQEMPREQVDRLDMTSLLQRLIARHVVVRAVPIADRWYEVDTEQDLLLYQQMPPVTAS